MAAYYTAKEMLRRGWEVNYICEDRSDQGYAQYEGIHIYRIPERRQYLQGLNYWALKKRMHEIKADFWYCRASTIYPVMAEKIARRSGGKTVWALGSDKQANPVNVDYGNKRILIQRRLSNFFTYKRISEIPTIVVQNYFQQSKLRQNFYVNSKICYSGHPLPPETALTNQPRENFILWIGHLRPGKRPLLFVSLAEWDLSKSAQYRIIASGNEPQLTQFIEDSAQRLPHLEFLGERSVDEVNQILLRARVLVTTSESEGFPNTHIQAWMRGVPVVSTGIDPDDLIKDKGLGMVVSNADELHDAVHKLVTDDQYWNKMSWRCRAFSESNFDIRRTVDKLIDILNDTDIQK